MSAAISIIEALDDPALFQRWFPGETWNGWRTVLKAANALPMTDDEIAFFRTIAERDPPKWPVKELWCIVGRRGGKDSVASVIAAHQAALFNGGSRLRPGERALVMCLAVDRDQAKIVLNYTRSYFADIDLLKGMVQRETANGFELTNAVDIAVATSSFRSVRGRPVLCAVLDEVAFWRDESSANPDDEIYAALKPALASIPGSIIIGISSPYRKSGLLYKKYRDHYGKGSSDVLVIKAPTLALNPTIDPAIIEEALAEDPEAASAEWLGEFRNDISAYISREAVEAVVIPDCLERPRVPGILYTAFVDPSGGASDSMTLAIAHRDVASDIAVLDLLREQKPPVSPDSVVHDFCETLNAMASPRCEAIDMQVNGAASRSRTRHYLQVADATKNDLYRSMFARGELRQGRIARSQKLITQIVNLERRTARGGRDTVDHAPGGHDDIANAVAGALHYAVNERRGQTITKTIAGMI